VLAAAPFRHFSATRAVTGRFPIWETQMASIRNKGDGYHCTFRYLGRRYSFAA
jgi:hypothetical protein